MKNAQPDARPAIAAHFDRAAQDYDRAAEPQAQIAERLVDQVTGLKPASILDIGSGTGFVAAAANRRWPAAALTAIDHAPMMLREAQRKIPRLEIISGDAAQIEQTRRYDLILSSMMLHWLPNPLTALQRWRNWLTPEGRMHIALLATDSFDEWRRLCGKAGSVDGLWPMPADDFADGIAKRREIYNLPVTYPSARVFLRRLKDIGGATPRPGYSPISTPVMRRILASAPAPFTVTYRVISLEIFA